MSSIIGNLFGSKPKASTSQSGYGALPTWAQDMAQAGGQTATNIANTTTPFQAVPYSQQQLGAINQLQAGVPQYSGSGFKFGQQANTAYGNANNMYGQASNYLAGAMPYIQQSAGYTAQGVNPLTGQEIQSSINDFMNPYTDSVINNSIRDISTYGNGLFSDARSLVSDAGGSGSNRANLLAGDIALKQMQAVGDTSSSLRNTGYQSAVSNALNRLQTERSNYLAGAGLSMNQATGMQNQSAGAMNIGNQYAGLGNNYLNAKSTFQNLGQNQYQNQLAGLNSQISAGDLLRGQTQQNNQIPLQQLQVISDYLRPLLAGSTANGGTPATQGLLASGGNYLQGGLNLLSAGMRL